MTALQDPRRESLNRNTSDFDACFTPKGLADYLLVKADQCTNAHLAIQAKYECEARKMLPSASISNDPIDRTLSHNHGFRNPGNLQADLSVLGLRYEDPYTRAFEHSVDPCLKYGRFTDAILNLVAYDPKHDLPDETISILREYEGRVQGVDADVAFVSFNEKDHREELLGKCDLETLEAQGIKEGDRFSLIVTRTKKGVHAEFKKNMRGVISPEEVKHRWDEFVDLL